MNKIIVIDDDDPLREIIVELLEVNEYEVISYSNGKDGVKGILENKPDLVVCDVMMPEIDGYEVLNIIRNKEEIKYIPFIFLTAKIENKDFRRGMNLGADDYLTKPFDVEELLKIIKSRIQKHQNLLKESEFKFRTLFEQSSDGILICDVDGNISDVNFGFTGMLGYSQEELMKMKLYELNVSNENIFKETLKNLKDYGKLIKEEMTIKDKYNDQIQIECTLKRIYEDKVQVIIRDITLFKKTECELLIAKNKAEDASKLKSALISYLNSEIKAPLNALIGYTEIILEKTNDDKYLNEIKQILIGGNRLLCNLNSVMKLTQLGSGEIKLHLSDYDICTEIRNLCKKFKLLAKFKELDFSFQCEENYILYNTDKEIMNLIISNLIDNAIKFTHHGSINVSVEKKAGDKNYLAITVHDTGIGIRQDNIKDFPKELRQIIDSFETGNSTGIGLTLAYKLAEYLGGSIIVNSEFGKGSEFSVTFLIQKNKSN